MSSKCVSLVLFLVGLIHLIPVTGVLGTERLSALYGIPVSGPDVEVLMRHRAVLFGLLGAVLVTAAFQPGLQMIALIAGVVSMASFIWLAWTVGAYNDSIRKVVIIDLAALACLLAAALLIAMNTMRSIE